MRVFAFPSILYATLIFLEAVQAYQGHSAFSKRGFPFVGNGHGGGGFSPFGGGGFLPSGPSNQHSPPPSGPHPGKGSPSSPQPPAHGSKNGGTTASLHPTSSTSSSHVTSSSSSSAHVTSSSSSSSPAISSVSSAISSASSPVTTQAPSTNPISPDNIQGDILFPFFTIVRTFFFFEITNATQFKQQLGQNIHDRITTATVASGQLPNAAVNLGFTVDGLKALGVTDNLGDRSFSNGQVNDVSAMGDPGTTNWVQAFTTKNIHGVFVVAANTSDDASTELQTLQNFLGSSISEQYTLQANERPGDQLAHEHFGFKDGISQPCVQGFQNCLPGQTVIAPGVLILGAQGDSTSRPTWAKGGSMMAFRQLQQLVPEFNTFLNQNAIIMPGFSQAQGAEFLGARMFGRWKDGTPLDLSPLAADPSIANDPQRNNNFTFVHSGSNLNSNQSRCPFSSHIRKTNPRADIQPENTVNHIMRSSIPYGPEVTSAESQGSKTTTDRGLAFSSYQSQISNGFLFQQQNWANLQSFPFGKNESAGFDAIIGANKGQPRQSFGLDPRDQSKGLTLPDFVVSKGGAYFFFPPVSALATAGQLAK